MIYNNGIPLIIICVVIIASILFSLQHLQPVIAQNEQIFDNKVFGLTVSYPFGWSLNEENIESDGTGYVEFLPQDEQSSIRIGNSYEEFSPEIIAKSMIEEFRKLSADDFRVVAEGPLTVNGRDAYDVFLTYKHPGKGMVQNEYIFIKVDDRLYSFSLQDTTSLGEYIKMASIMLKMVNTVDFIGLERSIQTWTRQ